MLECYNCNLYYAYFDLLIKQTTCGSKITIYLPIAMIISNPVDVPVINPVDGIGIITEI